MRKTLLILTLTLFLTACVTDALPSELEPTRITEPTQPINGSIPDETMPTMPPQELPGVVAYDLGETFITQSMFPEDSRFYQMPVRLAGIIGVPNGDDGPYPTVIILHGNHVGCPVPDGDMVDRWPCDPEVEQPNYTGFEYLVRHLAFEGYVALSFNINAEYTFGFGEPIPFERLGQLLDLHLEALAEASQGGANPFGVDLVGRADLSRLVFIGHSQGAEGAFRLIQMNGLDLPDAYANVGYGPAYGLIMIASAANWAGASGARIPLGIILPACDADVFNQDGQLYYEVTRLGPSQNAWASSIWLAQANHNYFNEILSDEGRIRQGRPDCEPLLGPEDQQKFLEDYTLDFLRKILADDPVAIANLGMLAESNAPDELYGLPAQIAAMAPASNRLPVLVPFSEVELETHLVGGEVIAEDVSTFYCEAGYYTPFVKPGSEPCKRVNLVIPGNPALVVVSWDQQGGTLSFKLPEGTNLNQYTAISLRAAVDPLSTLNEALAFQAFTVQLVDKQGNIATVQTRADEPALRFPEGYAEKDEVFEGGLFTGRVPLTTIRIPLSDFSGVDLSVVIELVLFFDQTDSGSLFIADIEFIR